MKLELKHLAPYLPYGLKGKWGVHIFEICGASFNKKISIRVKHYNQTQAYGSGVIPILRPLSDLTKEIEINGKKFIPYDKLKTVISKKQWVKICETINEPEYIKICDMPHWWVNLLYTWHFDVFGLIEKGLAIDINTL